MARVYQTKKDLTVWKKVCRENTRQGKTDYFIAELLIPAGAWIVEPYKSDGKCRCDRAIVVRIIRTEGGRRFSAKLSKQQVKWAESMWVYPGNSALRYVKGETVEPAYPLNRYVTHSCGSGIHFFRSLIKALRF